MGKAEMMRQSVAAKNAKQLEALSEQIESVRLAKYQNAEELGEALEPLAQAMTMLVHDTKDVLLEVDRRSVAQAAAFTEQMRLATEQWKTVSEAAKANAAQLGKAGAQLRWKHYGMTVVVGLVSGALASGLCIWRAPRPTIENNLDLKAVAEFLKPAVIAALKPSRGK